MRTLAVGDIHGCRNSLAALLRKVQPAATDQIIFLGDYIDRGPDSRGVIETLLKLKSSCRSVFLRGNHEEMMLDVRAGRLKSDIWLSCGGFETLTSYKAELRADWASAIPDSHWSFIEQTIRGFETSKEIFVHGCLYPDFDLDEQPDDVLLWETFGRIRPHKSGKRVICGHSSQPPGLIADAGYAVCIDSGAAYDGWLTCLDVGSNQYWQATEKGETRAGKLDWIGPVSA